MSDNSDRGEPSRLRVPPHSIDAEESLLGAMLLSEQATPLALRVLNACLILCVGGHVAVPVLERMQRSG